MRKFEPKALKSNIFPRFFQNRIRDGLSTSHYACSVGAIGLYISMLTIRVYFGHTVARKCLFAAKFKQINTA